MKNVLICVAAIFAAMSLNAQEVCKFNADNARNLDSENGTPLIAGTILGETTSIVAKIGANDAYKPQSATFTVYGVDITGGLQGATNPKDAYGGVPSTTLKAPVSGAFLQFEAKNEGYLYVLHKASSHKSYTVFEEGIPIGYTFAAIGDAASELGAVYQFTLVGEGEYNVLKNPVEFAEQEYLKINNPTFYEINWENQEKDGVVSKVWKKLGKNGLGVIKFPVYSGCKYIVNANDTKIAAAGFVFSPKDDVLIQSGDVVIYKGEGVTDTEYGVVGTLVGSWDDDVIMTLENGLYTATIDNVAAGNYEFKIRQDHNWTFNWGSDFKQDGPNCKVEVANDGSTINITFKPTTGEITWEVVDGVGYRFEVDGIRYEIGENNTVSVIGNMKQYSGDVVIPSQVTYDGTIYSVTSIEKNTFHRNSAITSVTIPNSVTSIGESAFGACTKLSTVSIPNSVTEIEPAAFYGCTALKQVNLPSRMKRIENNLFWGCTSLTSVTIPESVTSITEEAFRECSALPSIDIPNSVTEIGKSAFEKCSSLRVITIGSGVASIGSYAFANLNGERTRANNDNLKVYCKAETVPETDENAFDGTPTELSTLYVPASAVEKYRAAWPWSDFKEIVPLDNPSIPDDPVSSSFTEKGINYVVKDDGTLEVTGIEDGTTIVDILSDVYIDGKAYQVTSIGERAFEGRHDIEYLSIPWSVTSIGEYAFIDCGSSNMAVNIADPESWCQMKLGNEHSSPLYCAGKMLVHDIETTSISIPESVTSIGAFTFYQCSCIQSLYIPGSVTSIGSSAFEDCDYLTSLTLSDGLQKIGGSTFQGCTRLQTLTIPSTVKSIKLNAFADCKGITDVYCYADIVPETDDIAFHGTPTEKSTLHVPANAIEAYRTTWPWSDFKEIVALDADGIAIVKSGDGNNMDSDARIYDLQGNRQNTLQKGVNIIKMNNGKVKKVLVK